MFYVVRQSDNRIVAGGPRASDMNPGEGFDVIESEDTSAYDDIKNVWCLVGGICEIDSTYTPPEFDLSRAELRAILKLIVDQFNILRVEVGMNEITYAQAKNVIKTDLGL